MSEVTLTEEARQQLAALVESRPPGTPYRRRAAILLLADEGQGPAAIAPRVGLPVARVRLLLRAFKRQEMSLFPRWVLQKGAPFSPETEMAEAGRIALAWQLAVIREHEPGLQAQENATAVHETRKAIRRTRTLFRLLKPYFAKGCFRRYRRCLKETMRQLSRARDLHVFLSKMDRFREEATLAADEEEAMLALRQRWQSAKEEADEVVRQAARRLSYLECLEAYQTFTETGGSGLPATRAPFAPSEVRHEAAVHVYRRLAAVRAFERYMPMTSVSHLHQLRIRFKELRYTLEFFAPVLGWEIVGVLADLDRIQDHLGDLNDTRVALAVLAETEGQETAVLLYRAAQEEELVRLVDTFGPVWDTFNDVAWRRKVGAALSVL